MFKSNEPRNSDAGMGSTKNMFQAFNEDSNRVIPKASSNANGSINKQPSSKNSNAEHSNSETPSKSLWREKSYNGTIVCPVDVVGSSKTTYDGSKAKFTLKVDQIQIKAFDVITPNGAYARLLTCSLRELLKDVPKTYSQYDVNVKRLPDCSENLGPLVNIQGKEDFMIQVHPKNEPEKVYECGIVLTEAVHAEGKPPIQREENPNKQPERKRSVPFKLAAKPPTWPVKSKPIKIINNDDYEPSYKTNEPKPPAFANAFKKSTIVSDTYNIHSKQTSRVSTSRKEKSKENSIEKSTEQPIVAGMRNKKTEGFHNEEEVDLSDKYDNYPRQNQESFKNDYDGDFDSHAENKESKLKAKPLNERLSRQDTITSITNISHGASSEIPKESLILEHAYGYRTKNSRNNIFYTSDGSIVFPAGSLGVVQDIQANKQKFFHSKHKEDINAVALHPNGRTVATGDLVTHEDSCFVYLWDSITPQDEPIKIRIGEKKLAKGVADIAFSHDGKYLVVVAMDSDHMVYLYDLQKSTNKPIVSSTGHNDEIFGVTFNSINSNEFVTYGIRHVQYWIFDPETNELHGDRGLFGSRKAQSVICAVFLPDGTYVTGSHGGELISWRRNQVIGVVEEAHKGPIFGLAFHEEIGLFTGGKDGVIALRDAKLQVVDSVLVESGVRAMCVNEVGSLVVGMEDSVILEIHGLGSKEHSQNKVLEAHSASKNEELRGLAVNPINDSEFATAGDDSKVIVWNMDKRRSICQTTLNKKIRAITYSPDGTVLAVGSEDGDIYILQSDTLAQVFLKKYTQREGIHTSKHGICVLKFSPNGQYLAVGSYDRVLDIYDVPAGMKLTSCGIGHSSYISHLDWSTNSSYIQTNSANYDVMFWDVEGRQISNDDLKECVWATQNCILGPSVSGIWDKGLDGTDINWCDRNSDSSCLASGDDFLCVRLYSYPANKESMECKKYMGHGSFVSKVMFNKNGTRLISCGGNDGLALQWMVKCE